MLHVFISFLFFNIILGVLYSHYKKGDYYIKKSDFIIFIILLILFGTYGGGEGDYLHYKEVVEEYNTIHDVWFFTGMERHYVYLSYLVEGNYNLWRLVLFSVEFMGFGFFLYKAKLNTYPVLLCFTSFCLVSSVYGRSFWGAIYFFMGVYLLIEKKNPLYLIAIALCYYSHTSNLVLVALLPIAFINIKKWHFVVIILAFGTLVALFKSEFLDLLNGGGFDVEGADYLNSKLTKYGEGSSGGFLRRSIGQTTVIVLRSFLVISVLSLVFINIIKDQNRYLSIYKPVRSISNISIGLVLLSFIIMAASLGSDALFYRVFDMAMFPVSIILPCLRSTDFVKKKTFNTFILFFIFYTEFGYLKDLYYAYAGGLS